MVAFLYVLGNLSRMHLNSSWDRLQAQPSFEILKKFPTRLEGCVVLFHYCSIHPTIELCNIYFNKANQLYLCERTNESLSWFLLYPRDLDCWIIRGHMIPPTFD